MNLNTNLNIDAITDIDTTPITDKQPIPPPPPLPPILNIPHLPLIWEAFNSLNIEERYTFIAYCDIINLLYERNLSEILKIDFNIFGSMIDKYYLIATFLYIVYTANFHLKIPSDEINKFWDQLSEKYINDRDNVYYDFLHILVVHRKHSSLLRHKLFAEYSERLYNAIKEDNVDEMMSMVNKTPFESIVKICCDYSPSYYNELVESTHVLFITISMLCGSLKCFKYLILINHVNFNDDNLLAAIIGGNLEIFHIVEQHVVLKARHLEAAICWCRFDIAEYILIHMNFVEEMCKVLARECMKGVLEYANHIKRFIRVSSNHSFYSDFDLEWITQES